MRARPETRRPRHGACRSESLHKRGPVLPHRTRAAAVGVHTAEAALTEHVGREVPAAPLVPHELLTGSLAQDRVAVHPVSHRARDLKTLVAPDAGFVWLTGAVEAEVVVFRQRGLALP